MKLSKEIYSRPPFHLTRPKAPSPNVSARPITAPMILSKPLLFRSGPLAPLLKNLSCTGAKNGNGRGGETGIRKTRVEEEVIRDRM